MKLDYRWSIFWAILCLTAFIGEIVAVATNGVTSSFSAQVWFVLGLSPWVYWPALAAFGAGGAWLIAHFFRRRE